MRSPRRSCYVYELSIRPGGWRWAELHAYADPDHIRRVVERFGRNENGYAGSLVVWGDATFGIWIVQRGLVTRFIELRAFMSLRVGRKTPVPLADASAVTGLVGPADAEYDDDLAQQIRLGLEWDRLLAQLPALATPVLAPGEYTRIRHGKRKPARTYFSEGVFFGSTDAESGYRIKPPFRIRGWDPLVEYDDDC